MILFHKKTLLKKAACILSLLITVTATVAAQTFTTSTPSPFDSTTVKLFADDLYLNGFLDEAAGEYRRYLFSTSAIDYSAVLTLAQIYKTTDDGDGIIWLADNFTPRVDTMAGFKLKLLEGKTLFSRQDASAYESFASSVDEQILFSSASFKLLLPVSQYILSKDIKSAANLLTTQGSNMTVFAKLLPTCTSYKTKNQAVAVLLSAILPGAGRWYTGSFWGGFSTLFTVASFGVAAWYTQNMYGWSNWRPWVFTGMAAFSYTVELYGSAKSAVRYNDAAYRKIISETEQVYDALYE